MASQEPDNLLIFSKTTGYRHDSIAAGITALKRLTNENGNFKVTASEDASLFTPSNLSTYRVLVLLHNSGDFLSDDQLSALQGFVRSGGGVFSIHCAAAGMLSSEWYRKLIGAHFDMHPDPEPGSVVVVNGSNPINYTTNAGGPPEQWKDEWYNFTSHPAENENLEILLAGDTSTFKGGKHGVYNEVKAQLADVGYEHIDAVDLPSVDDDVADVERKADTNVVTGLLENRLNDGQDVVLVGNSYGATVIMEAVKELEDRSAVSVPSTAEGEGRVLGLVMLSGYIPTIAEVNHDPPRPDIRGIGAPFFNYHLATNGTPTTVTWDLDLANYPPQIAFYNLLDTSDADYWASQLLPSSFKALNATGTYIPYDGTFRTLYVIGKHDNSWKGDKR
ncbi:hypothetical protein N0V86_000073 [Didymella sp. IMI 355093]|nr:hypothetical protein N0V86_000073 [Didymella sp. IMI 355093]